jgi:hypothetical protein
MEMQSTLGQLLWLLFEAGHMGRLREIPRAESGEWG